MQPVIATCGKCKARQVVTTEVRKVREVLAPLAGVRDRSVAAVYGGTALDRDIAGLRKGVDVVIATPGRLIDLVDRGAVTMAAISILVVDEADRMADMGFFPQVEWLLRRIEGEHQTMLFSATLDTDVDSLVRHYMRDPVRHEVASSRVTV